MRVIKIAFISDHASPLNSLGGVDSGGQNVYVANLATQLASLGYEIDVFTRWDNRALPQIVPLAPKVRVIHIAAGPKEFVPKENLLKFMPQFTEGMLSFFESKKLLYSLIHAHFFMSALVASEIKKALRFPYVVTFHALGRVRAIHQKEADHFPLERLMIEEQVAHDADGIVAECPQDKEDLLTHYQAPEERLSVVPCGVDLQEFHPIDRQTAKKVVGLPLDKKVVLQLGRMVPRKGVETVVQSLKFLKKDIKDRPILVVVGGESETPDPGKTPEIGRLREIARKEKVLSQVRFLGSRKREELKYYYGAADVFVSTPWYEPFGITPLEAMACGIPVVGSNVGGIKFTVQDGKTGYLVPPKNPRALSSKLAVILEHPQLRDYLGANGRDRVGRHFTWEKVAGRISEIYERIIFGPSRLLPRNFELTFLHKPRFLDLKLESDFGLKFPQLPTKFLFVWKNIFDSVVFSTNYVLVTLLGLVGISSLVNGSWKH